MRCIFAMILFMWSTGAICGQESFVVPVFDGVPWLEGRDQKVCALEGVVAAKALTNAKRKISIEITIMSLAALLNDGKLKELVLSTEEKQDLYIIANFAYQVNIKMPKVTDEELSKRVRRGCTAEKMASEA